MKANMKILIDNGHGANTQGKRSPDGRLIEALYTREIAIRVEHELCKRGMRHFGLCVRKLMCRYRRDAAE